MSLLKKLRLWNAVRIIQNSGLFDEKWYVETYLKDEKDYKSAINHYCRHGWRSGLKPNPDFEGKLYQKLFLKNKEINPLLHYIRIGRAKCFEAKFYSDLERYAEALPSDKKNILFIGHDCSLSGAPLAVFNTAVALKNRGFNVASLAFNTGPLAKKYEEEDIPCFISEKYNGLVKYSDDVSSELNHILEKFDFIFCNTVLSCNLFDRIKDKKPHLWRIAEGDDIQKRYAREYPQMERILSEADKLYAVSEYTKEYLNHYNDNVELLLYGFPDMSEKYLKNYNKAAKKEKIKFCVIGYYSERKAQDIIIRTYRELAEDIRCKIEITFVGTGFEGFKDEDGLHFAGAKFDDEKYKILGDCDVLLCPSLDDPNPQVVMEGMMMKKPCVVSDMVGQKNYITDGVDGFIVKAGDYKDLAAVMKKIVANPEILDIMSDKSYDLYQKYFCFDKYINKVISIIKEKI